MKFQPSVHSNPTPQKTTSSSTETAVKILAGGLIVVVGIVALLVVKPNA